MTSNHPCEECGAQLHQGSYVKRTRVGRYRVEDDSQTVPICVKDHPELTIEDLAGYERRAAVVVLSEAADVGGAEIRFARKSLGLTQARLAALMDVAPETVSRWETGSEAMSRVSRLALLAIVVGFDSRRMAEGLARFETNALARTAEVLHVRAA